MGHTTERIEHAARLTVGQRPDRRNTPLDIQELTLDGRNVIRRCYSVAIFWTARQLTTVSIVLMDDEGRHEPPVTASVEFEVVEMPSS